LSPQPFSQGALEHRPFLREFTIFCGFIPVLARPPLPNSLDAGGRERFTSKVGDMARIGAISTGKNSRLGGPQNQLDKKEA
jgi:hypothetical protein